MLWRSIFDIIYPLIQKVILYISSINVKGLFFNGNYRKRETVGRIVCKMRM